MDVLVIGKPGRDAIDAAERAERRIGLPVQATVRTRTQWEAKRESFIKETPRDVSSSSWKPDALALRGQWWPTMLV